MEELHRKAADIGASDTKKQHIRMEAALGAG